MTKQKEFIETEPERTYTDSGRNPGLEIENDIKRKRQASNKIISDEPPDLPTPTGDLLDSKGGKRKFRKQTKKSKKSRRKSRKMHRR